MGLPKALLVLAATLFVASVLGTLAALGMFFWYVFEPGPILEVAAVILGRLSVSSGLLFVHFRSQGTNLKMLNLSSFSFERCWLRVDEMWSGEDLEQNGSDPS